MANLNAIPMVPEATGQERWKTGVQYILVGTLTLFFSYVTLLMYAQGEVLYGSLIMVFTALFTFVFLSERAYVWRYVFPGLIGVFAFVIFPIMYTLGLTFTNKSNLHLLSFEQAKSYFLEQTYIADGALTYDITLYEDGSDYRIVLESENGDMYITEEPLAMTHAEPIRVDMTSILVEPDLPAAERRMTITLRNELNRLQLILPDGTVLAKSKLREFSQNYPLWSENPDDLYQLINQENGTVLNANMEDGYFYDREGEFYSPGFQVNIGLSNYVRVLTEDGMLAPFMQIFIWTMFFAVFSVVVTFFIGMMLASFVQWDPIRGRGIYQLLLILPYAVPSFILIMIFRALFNQNFGQINHVLEMLFHISPEWNSDPNFTRSMILIVNLFLGYPYMFILSLGMLQSIPGDLYEASSLEGAGPLTNFFRITLPMVLRPMLPLLIASFAFNFNNFVLVQLLTRGEPIIIGSNPQAGETDLLVNYAFRLAFMGDTRDFALGATVSTFIFMMVGVFAVAYLKAAKIEVGIKR